MLPVLMKRRRRGAEEGQILVLALAFIAFFGLVVVAVLGLASATAIQHSHTEVTAQTDAAGEGGAAYAAADAARTDVTWCSGSDTGVLTMADGNNTSANYSVVTCNPGQTATTVGAKGHCLLCILNQTPFGSTPAHTPSTVVLSASCANKCPWSLQTTGGDDYINGSIGTGTTLEACSASGSCPGQAKIGVLGTSPNGCCTPTPVAGQIVPDPLASIGDPAAAGITLPSGCTSWQTCKPVNCQSSPPAGTDIGTWSDTQGCSISPSSKATFTLYPGVWNTIHVSGQANVILQPGVYVIDGAFSNSGQGVVCAPGTFDANGNCVASTGVTMYLACIGGTVSGQKYAYLACPASGAAGGNLSFTGGGNNAQNQVPMSLSAAPCPAGQQVPQCSGYQGVALLADPHLIDSSVSGCLSGSSCTVKIAGNGGSINGSVDTRSAGISISGGGSDAITAGFLITNSLFISVNGSNGQGMSLSGPGSYAAVGNSCNVLVLNVYSGPAPSKLPTAVIQSQCGAGNKQSGVVYFNYLP